MGLHNYKKAYDGEVERWIIESIPELTVYQKEKIRNDEIVRFSPFRFYKRRIEVKSFLIRLSVLFMPLVYIVLMISLPINFLITGRWGYSYEKISWFDKWRNNIGL